MCSMKQCIIIISLGERGSERFSARKIFSHQSSEFQRIKVGTHQAISCCKMSRRHVAATNRFVSTGQFVLNIFVAVTEFCRDNKSHRFSLI